MQNILKEKSLKHLVLATTLVLGSTSGYAQNSDTFEFSTLKSEQEKEIVGATSFLGGAAVGGLIAGPAGAIVGAVLGVLISDGHYAEQENQRLVNHASKTKEALAVLEQQRQNLENHYQLALAEKQNSELLVAKIRQQNTENPTDFTLHFKTNSSSIESHYQAQLEALAQVAKDMPNAVIEIDAFTDRRGNSDFNLGLSQNRLDQVVESLQKLGISQQNIQSKAYGEEQPLSTTETLEDNFFDRRVSVRIRSASSDLITQFQ